MKKKIFLLVVSYIMVSFSMTVTSCGPKTSKIKDEIEELGDTVPASEFAIIEDTTNKTPVDTVVASEIKTIEEKK